MYKQFIFLPLLLTASIFGMSKEEKKIIGKQLLFQNSRDGKVFIARRIDNGWSCPVCSFDQDKNGNIRLYVKDGFGDIQLYKQSLHGVLCVTDKQRVLTYNEERVAKAFQLMPGEYESLFRTTDLEFCIYSIQERSHEPGYAALKTLKITHQLFEQQLKQIEASNSTLQTLPLKYTATALLVAIGLYLMWGKK